MEGRTIFSAMSCVLLAVLLLGAPLTVDAQERPADTPATAESSAQGSTEEGAGNPEGETEEQQQRRLLRTLNQSEVEIGGKKLVVQAGHLPTNGSDYPGAVESAADGGIIMFTESMAVKLLTEADLTFGSANLKYENVAEDYPGVYSLWIKHSDGGWKFVFNEKADMWGTMHDPASDVGEVDAEYTELDEPTSSLVFEWDTNADGGALSLSWGKYRWSAPFSVAR